MSATLFDHAVFLALAVLIPLDGRRRFKKLVAGVDAGDGGARTREYRLILLEEWLAVAVVAAGWIVLGRSVAALGLVPEAGTPALIGYALTALAIVVLVVEGRRIVASPEKLAEVTKALGPAAALVPHRESERPLFTSVGVTAGICEEILYRGFLFFYVATWTSGQYMWLVVLIAGAVFGLAHAYQGVAGVIRTGITGVVFGALFWLTGSIWAPMVLHAVIDLNSGWVGWRAVRAR